MRKYIFNRVFRGVRGDTPRKNDMCLSFYSSSRLSKKCVLLITSLSSFYSSGVEGAATIGFFEPFISGIRSECKDKKYMMTDKSQSDKKKFRGVRGETPRKIKEFLSLFTLRPDYRDGSS